MKTSLKKILSVAVTGTMLLGSAGCLKTSGNKKDVLKAAEALASNMVSASADDLIKNSSLDKNSSEAVKLTELLDGEYSDDQLAFFKAVEKTITYEVDEDSCDVENDEATVDIIFTIADYDAVLEAEYADIDELIAAVEKADTKEIKFIADFVKEDKEWIANNVGNKKFMELYDYRNAEFSFALTPEMIAEFIDRDLSSFWMAEDGVYTDTTFIEYDYYFDPGVFDYADKEIYVYFMLLKDGEDIYDGDIFEFGATDTMTCRVDLDQLSFASSDVFEAGTYTIRLLTTDSQLIDEETVTVEVTPEPEPEPTETAETEPVVVSNDGEGVFYAYNDESFKAYVLEAKWFDYDGYKTGDYQFSADVETIAFSLKVTEDCDKTVSYYYAYTDDPTESSITEAINNCEYSNTISPTSYTNGNYYDIDYPINGNAIPGYYMFYVTDAETDEVLIYGYCEVGL